MRNFDSVIWAELQKENLAQFFMLELRLSGGTLRFTDSDIDVYHNVTVTSGSTVREKVTGTNSGLLGLGLPNGAIIESIMIYNNGSASINITMGDSGSAKATLVAMAQVAPRAWVRLTQLKNTVTANDIFLDFVGVAGQISIIMVTYRLSTPATVVQSHKFIRRPFRFNNFSGSAALTVDSVDVEIDDTDQLISSALLTEDARNRIAVLYIGVIAGSPKGSEEYPWWWLWETGWSWERGAAFAPNAAWELGFSQSSIVTQEFMRGIIDGWELIDDSTAKITITNEFVLWSKKTLRTQSASCQWEFKGLECAYNGAETWCDQSYERCKKLGNEINYIGNRYLPRLMESELWWGRTPNYKD